MPTEKIAPCPWCGEEPEVFDAPVYGYAYVHCGNSNLKKHSVEGPIRKTRAGAIKAWNERRPK